MSRGTSYILTLFAKEQVDGSNPDDDSAKKIISDYWNDKMASLIAENRLAYAKGQIERAPITGRLHVQAYIETIDTGNGDYEKLSVSGVRGLLQMPDTMEGHWEVCRSPDAVDKYCGKEETRIMALETFGLRRVGRYILFPRSAALGPHLIAAMFPPGGETSYGFAPSLSLDISR